MSPSARRRSCWPALLTVAVLAAGCDDGPATATPTATASRDERAAEPSNVDEALRNPSVVRLLRRCSVTRPNHRIPSGQEDDPGAEAADYHGANDLWTVLPPGGILVAAVSEIRTDGSIARKFPWWRGARGALQITGRRLDAPRPPLRAEIPDGYGPTGFQSSAIVFPTEGCWQVTASAGTAHMSFVTVVAKAPAM